VIAIAVVVWSVVVLLALVARRAPGADEPGGRRVPTVADLQRAVETGVVTANQAAALLPAQGARRLQLARGSGPGRPILGGNGLRGRA
jgi:hypothetical protein